MHAQKTVSNLFPITEQMTGQLWVNLSCRHSCKHSACYLLNGILVVDWIDNADDIGLYRTEETISMANLTVPFHHHITASLPAPSLGTCPPVWSSTQHTHLGDLLIELLIGLFSLCGRRHSRHPSEQSREEWSSETLSSGLEWKWSCKAQGFSWHGRECESLYCTWVVNDVRGHSLRSDVGGNGDFFSTIGHLQSIFKPAHDAPAKRGYCILNRLGLSYLIDL